MGLHVHGVLISYINSTILFYILTWWNGLWGLLLSLVMSVQKCRLWPLLQYEYRHLLSTF